MQEIIFPWSRQGVYINMEPLTKKKRETNPSLEKAFQNEILFQRFCTSFFQFRNGKKQNK